MKRQWSWRKPSESETDKKAPTIKSVEEYNDLVSEILTDDDWLDKMVFLVNHYLRFEPGGGNLHTVLEDGNIDDDHLHWVAGRANGLGDYEAEDIADFMRAMSERQRNQLMDEIDGERE